MAPKLLALLWLTVVVLMLVPSAQAQQAEIWVYAGLDADASQVFGYAASDVMYPACPCQSGWNWESCWESYTVSLEVELSNNGNTVDSETWSGYNAGAWINVSLTDPAPGSWDWNVNAYAYVDWRWVYYQACYVEIDSYPIGGGTYCASVPQSGGSPNPVITEISPSTWEAGTTFPVTITGTGFGDAATVEPIPYVSVSVQYPNSDSQINATVTVSPDAPDVPEQEVVVTSHGINGMGFIYYGGNQQTPASTSVEISALQASVVLSPEILYVSTGDSNRYVTTHVTPSSVSFTAVYNSSAEPSQPNGGHCNATLTIPTGSETGSLDSQVTASPAGCSGVIDVVAAAAGTVSQNYARVIVPPQKLVQMLNGEAGSQTGDMSQLSIGVATRNRFGDALFGGYTTYQDVIVHGGFSPSGIANGPDTELQNAGKVYTNDASTVGIVEDAKCFWSPKATQWAIVQAALQSQTTVFPSGTAAPSCWSSLPRQIIRKTSIGVNARGGEYAGAPAFLFLRQRNASDPAVREID